ncbi:hypothetical protein AAG570_001786 [Ranatra chinensis]|uniref:G-protein coupled receptors family 1 profile domain-containing protein n=1 Tax=Ranatra chinensis TaxID=642074 RepID=A0ABD0Y9J7_9HEMI
MLQSAYYVAVAVLGPTVIVVNLPVLVTSGLLLKDGIEPRATYIILGNISLADLSTAVFLIGCAFYPAELRDKQFCAVCVGLIVSCTLCSMLSVCLLAVERYMYIVHGLEYGTWLRPFVVQTLVATTWLVSFFCGLFPVVVWPQYEESYPGSCNFIDGYREEAIESLMAIVSSAMIVVVVMYIIIYSTAKKAARASNQEAKMKMKSVFVVFLSASAFSLAWCPLLVAVFIFVFFCDSSDFCEDLRDSIDSPLPMLGFFNSVLNPMIYAWWHRPFADAARRLVCAANFRNKLRGQAVAEAQLTEERPHQDNPFY